MYIIVLHNLFTGSASNVLNNTVLLKAIVFVKQQNRQIIQQNEEILKLLKNKEHIQKVQIFKSQIYPQNFH